jgi:hypothetical protein
MAPGLARRGSKPRWVGSAAARQLRAAPRFRVIPLPSGSGACPYSGVPGRTGPNMGPGGACPDIPLARGRGLPTLAAARAVAMRHCLQFVGLIDIA